jgi:hypothetical protein
MANAQVSTQKITISTKAKHLLVIVGGINVDSYERECWKMDEGLQFNEFTSIPEEDLAHGYSVCATDGGFIVTGGKNSDICYIFTVATLSWRKLKNMLRNRYYHGSVCIKGVLYVLGGASGVTGTDSVNSLVLTQGHWEAGPRLPQPVGAPRVAEINGRLYVLDPQTSKLYQLDVESRVWTKRAPIPGCDWQVSMVSVKGKLVVMGGENRICALYDPTSDAWTEGQQPRHEHRCGAVVYHDDRLLLMGGR